MKVPPTYDKDRTLTRRLVKGAGGGMLGVHYEDSRRPDVSVEKATAGRGSAKAAEGGAAAGAKAGRSSRRAAAGLPESNRPGVVREEAEMVLQDEDAVTRDTKAKINKRKLVARDRLTVDKDAPELRRKRRFYDEEDDEARAEEPPELDLGLIAEAIYGAGDQGASRAHLFVREEQPEPGDPSLLDPEAIQARLGTPINYAKHVMILAEAFRQSTGANRGEAIDYLGRMFVALKDRGFGRTALRELGPGTGIIDLYPLEVVAHVLERYPAFLPKVGFGRLFSAAGPRAELRKLVAGQPAALSYPPELKIRGFALAGGGKPGYCFEPGQDPGQYTLTIDTPGRYRLLVSGLTKSGHSIIETLEVSVRADPNAEAPPPLAPEELPPRDEAKIRAWPIPTPAPVDYAELLEEEEARCQSSSMSSGEIVRRQQLDAMRGPKGAEEEALVLLDAPRGDASTLEPEDGEHLSFAEQALLRLAMLAAVEEVDVAAPRADVAAESPAQAAVAPRPRRARPGSVPPERRAEAPAVLEAEAPALVEAQLDAAAPVLPSPSAGDHHHAVAPASFAPPSEAPHHAPPQTPAPPTSASAPPRVVLRQDFADDATGDLDPWAEAPHAPPPRPREDARLPRAPAPRGLSMKPRRDEGTGELERARALVVGFAALAPEAAPPPPAPFAGLIADLEGAPAAVPRAAYEPEDTDSDGSGLGPPPGFAEAAPPGAAVEITAVEVPVATALADPGPQGPPGSFGDVGHLLEEDLPGGDPVDITQPIPAALLDDDDDDDDGSDEPFSP